jgi:hypothetical protein
VVPPPTDEAIEALLHSLDGDVWQAENEFISGAKAITDILRSAKPLLQNIVEDHAATRRKN